MDKRCTMLEKNTLLTDALIAKRLEEYAASLVDRLS